MFCEHSLGNPNPAAPFVYTPGVRREQVLRQRLASFVQTVFDGQAEDLMLHLVEESDLSAEDLRRIEGKIQQRTAREPDALIVAKIHTKITAKIHKESLLKLKEKALMYEEKITKLEAMGNQEKADQLRDELKSIQKKIQKIEAE